MTNSIWKSKIFVISWQIVLGIFCLLSLTSKSGVHLFGILLILLSAIGLNWKNFFHQEKLAAGLFLLYPLAIVCGLFSTGHGESAFHVAMAWPWTLMVLPTVLVMGRTKDIQIVKYCLAISLAIACLQCFYNFGVDFDGVFNFKTRVPSFWDISRWGLFSGLSLIFLIAILTSLDFKKIFLSAKGIALLVLTVFDFICLFLSNNRGPWLGLGVALMVFFILCRKSWKILLPVIVGATLIFSFSSVLHSRFNSISDVEVGHSGITSKDQSNLGRLNMWMVASDFFKEQPLFGTGFENTEISLRNFLSRQTDEYRQKYVTDQYSYRDQHSSPITMLVQMGIIFSFAFWILVVWGFWKIILRWYKTRSIFDAALIAGILFHLVLCIVYTSFLSYEVVSFIPLLVMRGNSHGNA